MAALLLLTTADRADPAASPLLESLSQQDCDDWRLVVSATDRRFRDPRIEAADSPDEAWGGKYDLVSLLDLDTRLEPSAVGHVVRAMGMRPEADAVYGDELRPHDTREPLRLRTAWSPESIRSSFFVGDPFVVRSAALATMAAPPDTGRASRHDLALHLVETGAIVLHLPVPLATSSGAVTTDDSIAVRVNEHLQRCRVPAVAVKGRDVGTVRLDPEFVEPPSVSVVVPTAGSRAGLDERLVERCLRSLDMVEWADLDVVIVIGDEYDGHPDDLTSVGRHDTQLVNRGPGDFSFATAANAGVLAAEGDLVVLLNDDTVATDGGWVARLAMHAVDRTVGAVGSVLLYPDRSIQHIGMVIDDARPLHSFVGQQLDDDGPRLIAGHARTVAAVTGACLMVERRKYLEVGGMSPRFPLSFNDVDLCLKLARNGYRTVLEPGAVLIHDEGASRASTIEKWEWDRFIHRWGSVIDPWYHPDYQRPGDPSDLRRDADHLLPGTIAVPPATARHRRPRDTVIRPTVHHSRPLTSIEPTEANR
jgi:GT2 family glycosyltransferase